MMFSFQNREMDEYFRTLSPMIQHAVLMCGAKPATLEELRALAEGMAAAPEPEDGGEK